MRGCLVPIQLPEVELVTTISPKLHSDSVQVCSRAEGLTRPESSLCEISKFEKFCFGNVLVAFCARRRSSCAIVEFHSGFPLECIAAMMILAPAEAVCPASRAGETSTKSKPTRFPTIEQDTRVKSSSVEIPSG